MYVEIERTYGDGHYDDRKQRLDRWLEEHEEIDLRPVLEALYRARDERLLALLQGKAIDFARRLGRHQTILDQLKDWLQKLTVSYRELLTEDPMALALLEEQGVVDALDDLIELERSDQEMLTDEPMALALLEEQDVDEALYDGIELVS